MIKRFEGFRPTPYFCDGGRMTIGYGTTGIEARRVRITEAEADRMLRADVNDIEGELLKLISAPVTQDQFDALVSLTYNIGIGAIAKSTLLEKLNAGKYEEAAAEFLRWTLAGGRRLRGLVKRRQEEAALFGGDYVELVQERAARRGEADRSLAEFKLAVEESGNEDLKVEG